MIELEPLRPDHLEGFVTDEKLPDPFPEDLYGAASAIVLDGKTMAIFGGRCDDNTGNARLFLCLAPEARDYPVTIVKIAKNYLNNLTAANYTIRATAPDARAERWLEFLGFERENDEYVIWAQTQ